MAKTRAQENRAIRQEQLRKWLSEKCTAQHLVENIIKIEKLDVSSDNFSNELNKLKVANDQRLKILDKYLPGISNVTLSGDNENPLITEIRRVIVEPK